MRLDRRVGLVMETALADFARKVAAAEELTLSALVRKSLLNYFEKVNAEGLEELGALMEQAKQTNRKRGPKPRNPEASAEEKPKAKRGRPKKVVSEAAEPAEPGVEPTDPPKAKRGRPKKVQPEVSAEVPEPVEKPKAKRGRPKGSTNKVELRVTTETTPAGKERIRAPRVSSARVEI
jgi:outer membrane biosynthesis protein TonB